jgi:RNA polymerase sigma-70 factor, ECF subfamily
VPQSIDIDALYREHGEFVTRCLGRLVGPGPQVDDLVQETFIEAFRHRDRFDPARGTATAWLYGILRNTARHHLRRRRRQLSLHERVARQPEPVAEAGPHEHVEREQALRLLHRALATLPLRQREVFSLYELEGLDGDTIATIVGAPVGTVWTRLHHARIAMKETLRRAVNRGPST